MEKEYEALRTCFVVEPCFKQLMLSNAVNVVQCLYLGINHITLIITNVIFQQKVFKKYAVFYRNCVENLDSKIIMEFACISRAVLLNCMLSLRNLTKYQGVLTNFIKIQSDIFLGFRQRIVGKFAENLRQSVNFVKQNSSDARTDAFMLSGK